MTQPASSFPRLSRSRLSLAIGLCAVAATASAQQAGGPSAGGPSPESTLDTILVTESLPTKASSPKMTAPLLDTPQTISVIPNEVFAAQGARNLTDVLKNTPGISFSAGENGFASGTSNFSLRGFDTSGNIFVDGVRDSNSYTRDVFNVETVEVAKGPAADNGRGGAGGYINIVSKTPQLESFVRGSASYGTDEYDSDDRLRATLDVNQPLSDTSALRLNLLGQDGGVAGRELAASDAFGIAPSLAFGLGTPTRLTLAAQHIVQSGRPDWGVPGATIEDMLRFDPVAAQADRDNYYGLRNDYDDNDSTSLLARIEHDFSDNITLGNQTRWAETTRDSAFTVPADYDAATQQVGSQRIGYGRTTEGLSNQTSLNAYFDTGTLKHSLAAGLEFTRETSDGDNFPTLNLPDTDIFVPDPDRLAPGKPIPSETSRVEIDTIAAWLYDTVEFNERWQLTGGLRGERYDVRIASRNAAGVAIGPDGYDVGDTTVSGKLGVVYKPVDNGSLYAAAGVSSLPPGSYLSNPDISRTGSNAFPGLVGQNNEAAKTQRAVNFELGAKWNFFDDRLSTTAALFRTERRDVAISGKTPGDPASPTVLQGYGEQIVQGVELGVSGRITDAWSVFAGAVFLDSERRHSAFLDAARREANPGDYGDVLRTNGDELAFTPRRSANLWTTYTLPVGLTLGGGVQHVGDSFVGRPDDADRIIPNGNAGTLPGYTVLNLMAAYQVSEKLTLRLNVDNVTDELYAVSTNWPAQRVLLGVSRSYLLSADFRF